MHIVHTLEKYFNFSLTVTPAWHWYSNRNDPAQRHTLQRCLMLWWMPIPDFAHTNRHTSVWKHKGRNTNWSGCLALLIMGLSNSLRICNANVFPCSSEWDLWNRHARLTAQPKALTCGRISQQPLPQRNRCWSSKTQNFLQEQPGGVT